MHIWTEVYMLKQKKKSLRASISSVEEEDDQELQWNTKSWNALELFFMQKIYAKSWNALELFFTEKNEIIEQSIE
jgi:alpha-mannosidase